MSGSHVDAVAETLLEDTRAAGGMEVLAEEVWERSCKWWAEHAIAALLARGWVPPERLERVGFVEFPFTASSWLAVSVVASLPGWEPVFRLLPTESVGRD